MEIKMLKFFEVAEINNQDNGFPIPDQRCGCGCGDKGAQYGAGFHDGISV
jgi:hypothetical protein